MIKMNIIKYAFENSTQLNSTQLILYKKLFLGITISFSNDLLKYIQYFIHKLISLISVIFNAYYKKFNYKEFTMNNTKTIFKSLLIMIVAISLFTVSCSKDEGGTKTPTNPTPKDSATLLTEMLKGLGALPPSNTVIDFNAIVFNEDGTATIEGADNTKNTATSKYKVVEILTTTFTVENFNREIKLKQAPTVNNPTASSTTPLSVDIIFTANTGYEFDDSIINGKIYSYDTSNKEAKLTLKIKPKANWAN